MPKAASFGTNDRVSALILVPNGTLALGVGIVASGAFLGRDVDLAAGGRLTFQDGFADCTAASCNDGNACNGIETCGPAGACLPGVPVQCPAPDQCHDPGVCNPSSGVCSNPARPDGAPCSDGNACTQSDSCQAGACAGVNPVVCTPTAGCSTPGICQPSTGVCSPATGCSVGCGNGTVEPGSPPQRVRFSWLALNCDENTRRVFFAINGVEVVNRSVFRCSCTPGVSTVERDDPQALALLRDGDNAFSVRSTAELAWAVVELVGASTQTVVLFDSGGGGDAEARNPDACGAGTEPVSSPAISTVPVALGEQCDDGNRAAGDGCSDSCQAEVCGNWRLDAGEDCDDGNAESGDGCTAACRRESCGDGLPSGAPNPTAVTFAWAVSSCAPAGSEPQAVFRINGSPALTAPLVTSCSCEMAVQSVTVTDPALLALLDSTSSNSISFETTGTGESFQLAGWAVARIRGVPQGDIVIFDANQLGDAGARRGSLCEPVEYQHVSGDVFHERTAPPWGPEDCDDGNSTPGDGCSETCKIEGCGDGVRTSGEACDDGNHGDGDGCSATCQLEGCFYCDQLTGECVTNQEGALCSDGNACSLGDSCRAGFCEAPEEVTCPAPAACRRPGSCDPFDGTCFYPSEANGLACDDGSLCTKNDACQAGQCTGRAITCGPPNPCQQPGICAPSTGQCQFAPRAEGATCDDANVCTQGDRCQTGACVGELATCPNPTVANDVGSLLSPFYLGPNPPQTGVVPGTIQPVRAAALRGTVKVRGGGPLVGVTVQVQNHVEYGQTATAADGSFTMAVNGGETLTVVYEKQGYLPAQRQVATSWQDFFNIPEVALIPLDTQVTATDFSGSAGFQTVSTSPVTDGAGSRTARLFVPAGVTADLEAPDGSLSPAPTLHVRGTEYSVGEDGPAAMPAPLPENSGYTYAIEYSADEAMAQGATAVRFSAPLFHYSENFRQFPVGQIVPAGYYDRRRAAWIAAPNGRVVRIIGQASGRAEVDVDGSGSAASPAALAALGFSDDERAQLAALYPVGAELWRVPVPHFTPWDYNWPFGPPPGAAPPNNSGPETEPESEEPDCRSGIHHRVRESEPGRGGGGAGHALLPHLSQ